MPRDWYVVGCGRSTFDDAAVGALVRAAMASHLAPAVGAAEAFARRGVYVCGSYDDAALYRALAANLAALDATHATGGNHLLYLAISPRLYTSVTAHLGAAGLARSAGWVRVAVEKPHDHDLASARALARALLAVVREDQRYRIDHYLGKETGQNILMFRFANTVFAPEWNHAYIDHVQITVAEQVGVDGRADYFDQAGLLRDMFQNHLLQLLALVAMAAPTVFAAAASRDEKARVLDAVRLQPSAVARAQYQR